MANYSIEADGVNITLAELLNKLNNQEFPEMILVTGIVDEDHPSSWTLWFARHAHNYLFGRNQLLLNPALLPAQFHALNVDFEDMPNRVLEEMQIHYGVGPALQVGEPMNLDGGRRSRHTNRRRRTMQRRRKNRKSRKSRRN